MRTTNPPKLNEFFDLEGWAYKNNFYVHPEYIKAVKKKNKILVTLTASGLIITILVIKLIFSILRVK